MKIDYWDVDARTGSGMWEWIGRGWDIDDTVFTLKLGTYCFRIHRDD